MRFDNTFIALALGLLFGSAHAANWCYVSNELCEAQTNCSPCNYTTSEDVAEYPYCCQVG